jgi:hypothetical protein
MRAGRFGAALIALLLIGAPALAQAASLDALVRAWMRETKVAADLIQAHDGPLLEMVRSRAGLRIGDVPSLKSGGFTGLSEALTQAAIARQLGAKPDAALAAATQDWAEIARSGSWLLVDLNADRTLDLLVQTQPDGPDSCYGFYVFTRAGGGVRLALSGALAQGCVEDRPSAKSQLHEIVRINGRYKLYSSQAGPDSATLWLAGFGREFQLTCEQAVRVTFKHDPGNPGAFGLAPATWSPLSSRTLGRGACPALQR